MLLIIYSLFNLNNDSWGTRETAVPQNQSQKEVHFCKILFAKIGEPVRQTRQINFDALWHETYLYTYFRVTVENVILVGK